MININTINKLINEGVNITIYTDDGKLTPSVPEDVINILNEHDSAELELEIEGEYCGGAIVTHNQGYIDVMYLHEGTSATIADIIENNEE